MPRPRSVFICPKRFKRAKRLYECGGSQGDVAAMLAVSKSLVQQRIGEWGWTRNEELPPLKPAPPAPPPVPKFRFVDDAGDDEAIATETLPAVAGDLTGRLRRLVEREMSRLEARPGSPDVARTLGALARIIAQVNEMEPARVAAFPETEPEDTRDIHQFRLDLARKLEGLRLSREEMTYQDLADNPPFSVGPWGG